MHYEGTVAVDGYGLDFALTFVMKNIKYQEIRGSYMLSKIIKSIEKYSMIHTKDKIVIGFSGGADSTCLLYILLALKELYELTLIPVHVNHCLRETAAADENFVREACCSLGLPLEVCRIPVGDLAKEKGMSLEAAGRLARYDSFEKIMKKYGAHKIAVAHHQDDNAETILMNLLRGSGTRGLSGIPPVRGAIVRPLIDISREEIESYCHRNELLYCTDETNFSDSYLRNRMRLRIMPELKANNPSIVTALSKTGRIVREEDQYLDALAVKYYERAKVDSSSDLLSIKELEAHPDVMIRRILRQACLQYDPSLTNLSYEHIANLLVLMRGPTGKTLCLPGGLFVKKQYEQLAFSAARLPVFTDYCYDLTWNEFIFIPEIDQYATLSLEKLSTPEKLVNMYTKKFSYDKINNTIQVRNRRPGDKIYVRSMGGHKKIKDYFIDNKIPRTVRSQIPLVVAGADILWIMDEKSIVSDLFKPKESESFIIIQLWRFIK